MLRAYSTAASCAIALFANCQAPFSLRYDSFGQLLVQEGWAVELRVDSGYFVVHMSQLTDGAGNYLLNSVLVLDALGGLDTVTHVPSDTLEPAVYCGWTNSSDRTQNGGFVVGGSTSTNGMHAALLMWFDSDANYDTLIAYLPDAASFIGRQAKQAADGGYALVGLRSSNGNADAFLLKTDANGAQQWVQIYTGPSYDEFVAVDLVPGGGYYLGGLKFVPGQDSQNWVLRVDEQGAVIWERVWGSPYHEANAHLQTASDGHALVASVRATTDAYEGKLYMAKLDSADGSFVWQHFYGEPTYNTTLFAVKEVEPFGDLIATGQAYQNNGEVGVLLRTTSAGDSLWMRYYNYYDALVDSGDAQLRDVLSTPDGGFIAVGVAFGIGPYSQDVWVIKTDSLGCIEPGCNLIQGMETQITNLRDALTVAPNPVVNGSPVQVSVTLPENFAQHGLLRITVTDGTGRIVKVEQLRGTAGQLTTDNLRPGLYHLHLSDNTRWISGAKLIVE